MHHLKIIHIKGYNSNNKKIIPPEITFHHVKAHQDDKTFNLSHPAYLNCLADNIANNNTTKPKQCTPPETFAIFHRQQYIPQNFDKYMRIHTYNDKAKKYLMEKYGWDPKTYEYIDWKSHKKSFKNLPSSKQRQGTKFIHNYLPIGKLNFSPFNMCPYCGISEKNISVHHYQDHPFICKSANTKKILDNIQHELFQMGFDTTIGKLIYTCLTKFYSEHPIEEKDFDKQYKTFI